MIDPDTLNVWFESVPIGCLRRNLTGAIGFVYDSVWVDVGGLPVSWSMPLSKEYILGEHNVAHRFFANLLPEGSIRERLVRELKIPDTDFDLLRAIGGECAGAFSILPVEGEAAEDHNYRRLSNADLSRLIAQRGRTHSIWSKERYPRVSLAGAQDKFPVMIRKGRYFLPEEEAPTSHILKLESPEYRHLLVCESFTNQLARQIGLPVVQIELHSIDGRCFARIERYDRLRNEIGELRRLHQEDFCQALGYGHENKYEENGGPTFADCLELLRDASTDPAIDTRHLLQWQIFNVLAGNSDGHAKNLSLLYLPNGDVRLAPFYDLICTRAIDRIDYRLAFAVGGQRDPDIIAVQHWDLLAKECDIGARFLRNLVKETATSLLDQFEQTRAQFEADNGEHPSLRQIEKVIRKQCSRVI